MTQPRLNSPIRFPLLAMFIRPRTVIRDLIAKPNLPAVLLLSAIGGIFLTIILVAFRAPGVGLILHPAVLAAIGAAGGIAALYICGAMLWMAAAMVGGTATLGLSRRALAWTLIPNVLASTLVIAPWLLFVAYGALLTQHSPPGGDWAGLALLLVLISPLGVWGLFITMRTIGAVLGVDALRAALCILLVGGATGYTMIALADQIGAQFPSILMPNAAMLPTLRPDQRVLLKLAAALSRGDVVLFTRQRNDPHSGSVVRPFVKRVIGLPGDEIVISGGLVSINGGRAQRQPMAAFAISHPDGPTTLLPRFRETLPDGASYAVIDSAANPALANAAFRVPPDQIFLLGDNRDDTDDMPDSYGSRPAHAHPGLAWLDRVSMNEIARMPPTSE